MSKNHILGPLPGGKVKVLGRKVGKRTAEEKSRLALERTSLYMQKYYQEGKSNKANRKRFLRDMRNSDAEKKKD